jgi:hypothetical protein
MRIATWNLERPTDRQPEKIEALKARMLAVDADVWILTETNSCVSPGSEYQCLESRPITGPERYAAGENRTTIWSRLPMGQEPIKTHDPETAVYAEIKHGDSLFLIYGTIIPYQHAGTSYPYRFEGAEVEGKKAWELHYESIGNHAADWRRLRDEFPAHLLVVAGDFNQNRDGRRWYGTKKGRQDLGAALASVNLACATEGVIEPVKEGDLLNPTVDHICLDRAIEERGIVVRGWPAGETPGGKRLTDHTGVYVDVPLP